MRKVEITHPIEINPDMKQMLELVDKNIKAVILTKFQRSSRDIEDIKNTLNKTSRHKNYNSWDEKYTGLTID